MNRVVNGVKIQSLRLFSEFGFACGCAVFGFDSHFEILLRGVGYDFAEHFRKLSRVLRFFVSRFFPVQTDFGIPLAERYSRHGEIHSYFGTFSVEVCSQTFDDFFGYAFRDTDDVFGSPGHPLFLNLDEFVAFSMADGTLGRTNLRFYDLTANCASPFFHNVLPLLILFCAEFLG